MAKDETLRWAQQLQAHRMKDTVGKVGSRDNVSNMDYDDLAEHTGIKKEILASQEAFAELVQHLVGLIPPKGVTSKDTRAVYDEGKAVIDSAIRNMRELQTDEAQKARDALVVFWSDLVNKSSEGGDPLVLSKDEKKRLERARRTKRSPART